MHGVSLIFCCIPWFAVIALLVYITSRPDEPPTYHKVFYLLAILGAIFVICIAVKNVMDIILVISYVTQLSAPFLESTFVTVGYSIGYLVSNIQFAREGYAKMAFAACFGGPMNCELELLDIFKIFILFYSSTCFGIWNISNDALFCRKRREN